MNTDRRVETQGAGRRQMLISIPILCASLLILLTLSALIPALPVVIVLLLYVHFGTSIALCLRIQRRSWPISVALAVTVCMLNASTVATLFPYHISGQIFLEGSTVTRLDKSLWKATRGQYLLLPSDITLHPPPGSSTFLLDSRGRSIESLDEVGEIFSQALGRPCTASIRFGFCDMGLRWAGVLVTF